MTVTHDVTRRRVLRGVMGGTAVTVGLPFLDCFLNNSGTALASGERLPVVFGTWFQGLGLSQGFWEPKTVGAKYAMAQQLQPLAPFRDKINIYSGMKLFSDGKPIQPHATGPAVCFLGDVQSNPALASIDSLIADSLGQNTRFRSLEVSCHGLPESLSRRSGTVSNPSESSPIAFYQRIFGPEFTDPNAANFQPNPTVMVRKSVLSSIKDHRSSFARDLGASDKARLDEYFTSVRELENQLELQLQRPAPLEACSIPRKPESEGAQGSVIEDALINHKLFAGLLAHAAACGQTRVFNVMLSTAQSNFRRTGSSDTFHVVTHEEGTDSQLGYQPKTYWFQSQTAEAFSVMLAAFDGIREGDATLLDRSLIYFSTDTGYAKMHTVENIPLMTAGGAAGRMKTGMHIAAAGETVTRLGLTIQQVVGMQVGRWGTGGNETSKPFAEVMI